MAPSATRIQRPAKSVKKTKSRLKKTPPALTKKQKTRPGAVSKPAARPPDVAIIYKDTSKKSGNQTSAHQSVYREKWLLQQNPSFYTIQIMGGRNEKALRNYVKTYRHHYRGPMAYYQTKYKGGRWYPLLYGLYPTLEQAAAAKRALPQDIQKLAPWIRKMSAVQTAIRESNK